ncbi:MAG TPA: AI-2E family transporter [Chthoniobacterales bacterium]
MTTATRVSYAFIIAVLVLAGATHLATPLVAVLFSYFALRKLRFSKKRWLSLVLFLVLVAVVLYGIGLLTAQAVVALPKIAAESIPPLISYAQRHGFELPFYDLESLKTTILDVTKDEFLFVGNFARAAGRQFVFVLIAIVVAISLFLRSEQRMKSSVDQPNLFNVLGTEIKTRFQLFYESFERVMGAQITISSINTVLTAIFVATIGLKYFPLIVGMTFFCGLLPIVGNLISNSVIVGIAFTSSARAAIAALVFLVLLHKLEYFLNSKIIGSRIKNPMWLTLLALVIGERCMGIPGMILAPVVLDYVKVEMTRLPPPS